MTAEDSDDDMEDMAEEGIPMQGEDGQHYVVLEVWKGYLIVLNYSFLCLEGLYSSSDPKLSSANKFLKYILVCISQQMIIMFR